MFSIVSVPIYIPTNSAGEFPSLHILSRICRLWECKLVHLLWRTIWRFFKNLKIELPYDPAIPLLGIYPEKNMAWKDICTPAFIAALFTIAKTWKQPKCSLTEECIKKMWYCGTYVQWNITQPLKRMKSGHFLVHRWT